MPRALRPLWDEKRFDAFVARHEHALVLITNFLCPACANALGDLAAAGGERPWIGRIHLHPAWVNRKAGLTRDVPEENIFLAARYGVGKTFPAALIFARGKLVRVVEGGLSAPACRRLIGEIDRELSGGGPGPDGGAVSKKNFC